MTDGYAASPAGSMSLFHAHQIARLILTAPKHRAFDLEHIRLMLNLTESEFREALHMCRCHALLPEPVWLREPPKH